MMNIPQPLKIGMRMGAMVYAGLLLVVAGCQSSLIYHPARGTEQQAVQAAMREGLVAWRNAEGELIGWRSALARPDADALLAFHGNAGSALHRGYLARGLDPYFAVHILEYPGYGSRPGRPREKTLYAAAEEALGLLRTERSGRVFLAGESLGSGVACHLAGTRPDKVAGLFLITPFTSLPDVGRSHYPFLPVGLLLRDRYDNESKLERYSGPLAVLLAERDNVVPARLGQELFDGYAGPKRLWIQAGRNHNTLDYNPRAGWWAEVAGFLTGTAGTGDAAEGQ